MNSASSGPDLDQWRALYAAADAFKTLAPWEWMFEDEMFGVKNPADGKVGYCSVMGKLEEVFALSVYPGSEGLETYKNMRDAEFEDWEGLFLMRCLMVSFENRNEVWPEDMAIIKALGLKYRGRNTWPVFRSRMPGFAPWFLTRDEASLLRVALEQAVDVCSRVRENPGMLTPPEEGEEKYLVRVRGGDGRWRDEWLAPEPLRKPKSDPVPINEVQIALARKAAPLKQGTWEVDAFHAPVPFRDNDDDIPRFPAFFIWVDRESAFVLNGGPLDIKDERESLVESLLDTIVRYKRMPKVVLTQRKHLAEALGPVADRLGITVSLAEDGLETLEEIKMDMFEMMRDAFK